eukprot:scaffold1697_cov180-Amphora_coffeaeformis.AAC.16
MLATQGKKKRFRITSQMRDMTLLGIACFLLGYFLRTENKQLQPYRLSVDQAFAAEASSSNKADSIKSNNKRKKQKKTADVPKKLVIKQSTNTHVREPGTLLHIIKTRFFQYQPDSPELVQARIQLLRTFVLPAMVHQTSQNFFWIVSVEPDLDATFVNEIKALLQPYPHYYLSNVMLDRKQDGGRDIIEKLDAPNVTSGDFDLLLQHVQEFEKVPVLETRIDADEALHVQFVETVQKAALEAFEDKSLNWMYWCVNRAMHFQWFPTEPSAYLESDFDSDACAIPGLTVGFREGGNTENFYRTRAIFLQKELAEKEPWCGAMNKGSTCLHVLNQLEYPVLRLDTPAAVVTEKPSKSKNETERKLPESTQQLAQQYFAVEPAAVDVLNRKIHEIPPYYMHPPKSGDRAKDEKSAAKIAKIDPSTLLFLPDNSTLPGNYNKTNRNVFHIVKTRFMQHQPDLKHLGKARVELFKTFCLPSMIHQTTQNFFWLIYTDPKLDKEVLEEMTSLLKPFPHFYLVSSLDDKRGLAGKDIKNDLTPKDFFTGDTAKLFYNLNHVHFLHVLESRLDADDALNVNWIKEVQRRANKTFKEEDGRDWMYWCINRAVEWNWVGPADRRPLKMFGALIFPRPYDERNFCHTPGMTVGFRRGSFTRTVAKGAHQLIYEKLEKQKDPCGGPYKGTECIDFIGNFTYAALRSRTPTSASMAGVNTNGGKAYRLAAEDGVKRWKDAIEMFALLPSNAAHINEYFFRNMKPILEDNLKGQCTDGHSCRDEAKAMLNQMIRLYSLKDPEKR